MGTRSEALAAKVEAANNSLLSAIEASTPEQWGAKCADGEWTQGFAGYHAAASIEGIAGMVQGMADGGPLPPFGFSDIDQQNAEFHKEHSECTKPEAIELVRKSSPAAAGMVRGLSDEQLDRATRLEAVKADVSVEQLIEMLLIGHPTGHLESITRAR